MAIARQRHERVDKAHGRVGRVDACQRDAVGRYIPECGIVLALIEGQRYGGICDVGCRAAERDHTTVVANHRKLRVEVRAARPVATERYELYAAGCPVPAEDIRYGRAARGAFDQI